MSDLDILFNKFRNNNVNQSDLNKLTVIIKEIIRYQHYPPEEVELEDIISEIIVSLFQSLKNSEYKINNPNAYLRAIVNSKIQTYSYNHSDIQQLVRHTRTILEDLEKQGKIYSYQNRKYCINRDQNIKFSKDDILQFGIQYDFTEINCETRWTQKKKDLISKFILEFLDYIKCVDFSTLIDILKIKLGLKMTKYSLEPQNPENDDYFNNNLEDEISMNLVEEDMYLIKEISDTYEKNLQTFLKNNTDKNKKIITILYLYYFEEKSLQEIAQLLSYKSPTTIQLFLQNNNVFSPNGFLSTQSLIDEKIFNHFNFLKKLEDELLNRLEIVYKSMMNDV